MSFRNVLQLLFASSQLLEESLRDALKKKSEEMQRKGSATPIENASQEAKLSPQEILTLHTLIKAKRKALALAVLWILTPAILGFATAQAVNTFLVFPSNLKFCLRFSSILIVAFATFSRLGEITTYDGGTLPERTNMLLFKLFYSFGFFLAVTVLFLNGD